jgi:uncharacterized coiled-coil DUF342 family protein
MTRQQTIEERKAERDVINHIHTIRRQIQDEEKGMTSSERTARLRAEVQELIKKHGLKINYVV